MRLIQHKNEAYWFYRFLSIFYDKHVNPFFWNIPMRNKALKLGNFTNANLKVIDVGAGTGFTTEGIIDLIDPSNVSMLDQSPHQLKFASQKEILKEVKKFLGDAENLPFPDDSFDRYVSAGSIEYWPDPQRGVCESFRVIKPGGIALLIGPVQVRHRILRMFSDMWMLFPSVQDYINYYKKAGFENIKYNFITPDWVKNEYYGIAISGTKNQPGKSPLSDIPLKESSYSEMGFYRRLKFFFRFFIGSFFGGIFVPVAIISSLKNTKRLRLANNRD
jgi:MPBQ/MSBQ methyltransferase